MREYFLKNKEGERMSIRVDENIPGHGILILLDREEKVGPFLNTTDRKYPIVSLRQPPELCGIDESAFDPAQEETWIMPYRNSFGETLADAVKESGIQTLIIAGGGVPWMQSPYATYLPELVVEEIFLDI
jgi:hypothetical protein